MCKNHKKSGVRCGMSVQFVLLITVTSLSRFFLISKTHLNCVWCLVTFPWTPSSLETNSPTKNQLRPVTRQQQCPCPCHGRSLPICSFHQPATRRLLLLVDHVGGTKVGKSLVHERLKILPLGLLGDVPNPEFSGWILKSMGKSNKKSHTFQISTLSPQMISAQAKNPVFLLDT